MAEKVDYAALKKGGFMRQKQKGCFSLRIAVVGGNLTAERGTGKGRCRNRCLRTESTYCHSVSGLRNLS